MSEGEYRPDRCPESGKRPVNFELSIPPELVEAIAQRAAQLTRQLELEENPVSPYMTIDEAAEYLRCRPKRIYDLRSSGRLARVGEGGRALVLRAEIEALVVVDEDGVALPRRAA
jgi:excisionase family DNA binding protein